MTPTQTILYYIGIMQSNGLPYNLTYEQFDNLRAAISLYANDPESAYKEGAKFVHDIMPAHVFDDGERLLLNKQIAQMLLFIAAGLSA